MIKPAQQFDLWDDLLMYIHEGRVVPIVGQELLTVDGPDGPTDVYALVAGQLADQLRVSREGLPPDPPLDDVVARYLGDRGKRERLYTKVTSILEGLKVTLPKPLRQLAQIPDFRLFVTTTADSLLENALRTERPGKALHRLDYAPNNVKDLPDNLDSSATVVYHMLGVRSSAPTFALTQEDLLEFMHGLQSERPVRLFDELRRHHLLLIGTGFPDWIARLFIRITKGAKLSLARDCQEFVADRAAGADQSFVLFLRQFSLQTEIYSEGSAEQFVDELHRRYFDRYPRFIPTMPGDANGTNGAGDAKNAGNGADKMPPGAVFISYAHEDLAAAQMIHDSLEGVGIDVWFDKQRLDGGDEYGMKISQNIRECALFVPLVSASTTRRLEGYFRREWLLASQRAEQIADGVPFIVPTAIDDTPASEEAMVPSRFLNVHWQRLPDGRVTPEYVRRFVELVRQHRSRKERARL